MKNQEEINSEKSGEEKLRILERQADAILVNIDNQRGIAIRESEKLSDDGSSYAAYAKRLNQKYSGTYKQEQPLRVSIAGIFFIIFFLGGVASFILSSNKPSPSGPYREVTGVVQSAGLIFVGTGSSGPKGNAVIALVKVSNGDIIKVRIKSNAPIQAGAVVHLRKYTTGAYGLSEQL